MKLQIYFLVWAIVLLTGQVLRAEESGKGGRKTPQSIACLTTLRAQLFPLSQDLLAARDEIGATAEEAMGTLDDSVKALADAVKAGDEALAGQDNQDLFAFKYTVTKMSLTLARSALTRAKSAVIEALGVEQPDKGRWDKITGGLDNLIAAFAAAG